RKIGEGFKDEKDKFEFIAASDRLRLLAAEVDAWVHHDLPDSVYWIERVNSRRGHTRLILCAAPIDVGPALREHLFEAVPSVIMTSATLAVGRKHSPTVPVGDHTFDYFKTRVGLTRANVLQLGSPFDYANQVELICLEGMPDPNDKMAYEQACVEMIRRYVAR